jgi:hypothetical protein
VEAEGAAPFGILPRGRSSPAVSPAFRGMCYRRIRQKRKSQQTSIVST